MVDTYVKHHRFSGGEKKTNRWVFAVYIGFFAGLIWGGLRIVEYYLRLTDLVPGFLVEFYFRHDFLTTKWGGVVGWVFFTIFSIAASLIYAAMLHKARGPWNGLAYGLIWWGLLYLLIGPSTGMMPWIYDQGWNTIITDLCLFALWGLFIGYSINVEFTDEPEQSAGGTLN